MDLRSSLSQAILPAAESHLHPIIKNKAIDTMTREKKLMDDHLSNFISRAFSEAHNRTKEKLAMISVLESVLGKDLLNKIFGNESQSKVFNKVIAIYEDSKPEAGDKAADATIKTLKDVLQGTHGGDTQQHDRSLFSNFKNEMQNAMNDVANGGNVFEDKISHVRSSLLNKSDAILQEMLDSVKFRMDGETRGYIRQHLETKSQELFSKIEFKSQSSDRGMGGDGFKGFLDKAKEQVAKHAQSFMDNPKEKISEIMRDLENKISLEVMEEVQKILDMIKSNSRDEMVQWFNQKFHLK